MTRDFPASQGNNEFYRQRIIPGYESDGFITPTDSGEFRAQFHPDFPDEEPSQQKLGVGIQTSAGDLIAYAWYVQFATGAMRPRLSMAGPNLGDDVTYERWAWVESYQDGEIIAQEPEYQTCYRFLTQEINPETNLYNEWVEANFSADISLLYELQNEWDNPDFPVHITLPSRTVASEDAAVFDVNANPNAFCFED